MRDSVSNWVSVELNIANNFIFEGNFFKNMTNYWWYICMLETTTFFVLND